MGNVWEHAKAVATEKAPEPSGVSEQRLQSGKASAPHPFDAGRRSEKRGKGLDGRLLERVPVTAPEVLEVKEQARWGAENSTADRRRVDAPQPVRSIARPPGAPS